MKHHVAQESHLFNFVTCPTAQNLKQHPQNANILLCFCVLSTRKRCIIFNEKALQRIENATQWKFKKSSVDYNFLNVWGPTCIQCISRYICQHHAANFYPALAAGINCASLALADAGIEMTDLVTACSLVSNIKTCICLLQGFHEYGLYFSFVRKLTLH